MFPLKIYCSFKIGPCCFYICVPQIWTARYADTWVFVVFSWQWFPGKIYSNLILMKAMLHSPTDCLTATRLGLCGNLWQPAHDHRNQIRGVGKTLKTVASEEDKYYKTKTQILSLMQDFKASKISWQIHVYYGICFGDWYEKSRRLLFSFKICVHANHDFRMITSAVSTSLNKI